MNSASQPFLDRCGSPDWGVVAVTAMDGDTPIWALMDDDEPAGDAMDDDGTCEGRAAETQPPRVQKAKRHRDVLGSEQTETGKPQKRTCTSWALWLRSMFADLVSQKGQQRPIIIESACSGMGTHALALRDCFLDQK